MNNDEKMKLYKLRILRSFKWHKDLVVPLSKELGISEEEFEDILMKHLDMSSLEALHSTYESAIPEEIMMRLHVDLKFIWYVDVLQLISDKQATDIKVKLLEEILHGMEYEDALDEGRKILLEKFKS
jgi:energy-converting hydrogenase A subunit M